MPFTAATMGERSMAGISHAPEATEARVAITARLNRPQGNGSGGGSEAAASTTSMTRAAKPDEGASASSEDRMRSSASLSGIFRRLHVGYAGCGQLPPQQ